MDIKIVIQLPGIPEAITALANAIRLSRGEAVETENPETKALVSDVAAVKKQRKTKAAAEPTREEVQVSEPIPDPEPIRVNLRAADTHPPEEQKYTLDQISYAGVDLMERGHMDDLFKLLEKHNIQSLTAAKPEQYGAIAADLIAMGAVIQGVE